MELVLLSATPRQAVLTLAVPLSAERLQLLEGSCSSYGGPVSAAVYLGLTPEQQAAGSLLDDVKRAVHSLFGRYAPRARYI